MNRILTVDGPLLEVPLRDVPAALEQKLTLATPLLAQSPRNIDKLVALHIIQHDNIRAGVDGFLCFCFRPDLDLEEQAKSADFTSLLDSICDRPYVQPKKKQLRGEEEDIDGKNAPEDQI